MLTTQLSLIARLKDPDDHDAWQRFVCLYLPSIVRSLQHRGLQHADAEDTAQQILLSIAKTLAKRPHDPNRARFRTWLDRVIRNAAINAMQRAAKDRADGGSSAYRSLQAIQSQRSDEETLRGELRRQIFHVAADRVKAEFEPATWDAFWRTSVLGESIDTVAQDLQKQRGSVYAARSRVMARFRAEVEQITDNLSEP